MTTHESTHAETPRRVTVTRGRHGWEVMEEQDHRVVRRALYTDWHRVERAMGRDTAGVTDAAVAAVRPQDPDPR